MTIEVLQKHPRNVTTKKYMNNHRKQDLTVIQVYEDRFQA